MSVSLYTVNTLALASQQAGCVLYDLLIDLFIHSRRAVIPRHRWVMNGAVMFGREFCYAMETALVTPVLLRIGLPEQYYSLTWFLSPVLGLFFTPLIGSTSDRCTLRWGRRRPFILALCVGVLLGVALFLNGALIALTVIGVIVLDFCADAADGPIRAYLLDVADTEEQDMALNIHAFSAGLGGAVGYMLGGLDWTGTALGQAFKAQEQVLFMFTAVVFIISVTLHMFSIPEQPISPRVPGVSQNPDSTSQSSLRPVDHTTPMLDAIAEESYLMLKCLMFVSCVFQMPTQLWRLCICHLLTWFAYIAEAVFFTDFMGQVIFQGDPIVSTAPVNSTEQQNYLSGVQMGCWGLVVYAATSAICSAVEWALKTSSLSLTTGTAVMATFPNVYVALVMISTMGVISMSISYCPYALLGQYHEIKEVSTKMHSYVNGGVYFPANTRRGFGIDCAILSCQVYISQILVASALGAVVDAVGSVRVIPVVASGGSFLGFLTACFLVIYPDVEPSSSEQNQEVSEEKELNGEQRQALLDLTNHEGANKTQTEETAA
uniref:Uncharacterized protein n=1 Tax=Periophthalmus magnuspinnatus TaxID=409849 RepID=A0A3B3ZD52_9GOBI